jgi:hypothetical protein
VNWRYFKFVLPSAVLLLGGLNLAVSAGPKHFRKSIPVQMAACVAGHMEKNDLFLATEWNWSDYLHYVHDRQVVSFIGEVSATGNKANAMEKINQLIRQRHEQGGRVYMTDIRSYPDDYMKWLNEQTALTAADLRTYKGTPSFACIGTDFLQLD